MQGYGEVVTFGPESRDERIHVGSLDGRGKYVALVTRCTTVGYDGYVGKSH